MAGAATGRNLAVTATAIGWPRTLGVDYSTPNTLRNIRSSDFGSHIDPSRLPHSVSGGASDLTDPLKVLSRLHSLSPNLTPLARFRAIALDPEHTARRRLRARPPKFSATRHNNQSLVTLQ
jgi:hypothetical protein